MYTRYICKSREDDGGEKEGAEDERCWNIACEKRGKQCSQGERGERKKGEEGKKKKVGRGRKERNKARECIM